MVYSCVKGRKGKLSPVFFLKPQNEKSVPSESEFSFKNQVCLQSQSFTDKFILISLDLFSLSNNVFLTVWQVTPSLEI